MAQNLSLLELAFSLSLWSEFNYLFLDLVVEITPTGKTLTVYNISKESCFDTSELWRKCYFFIFCDSVDWKHQQENRIKKINAHCVLMSKIFNRESKTLKKTYFNQFTFKTITILDKQPPADWFLLICHWLERNKLLIRVQSTILCFCFLSDQTSDTCAAICTCPWGWTTGHLCCFIPLFLSSCLYSSWFISFLL